MTDSESIRTGFLAAATWHGSLDAARQILADHPGLAHGDIHVAAVLADVAEVRRLLQQDRSLAMQPSPPYGANALVYLGLSKYLRLDPSRSSAFVATATALLDAGADPNSGFLTPGPHPEFETAIYGAAGVAHHPALTALLLQRGADPNDEEVGYHSPEGYDSRAMQLVVETGRVTQANLAMMLVRKHDWHDREGVRWLLAHGASPNHERPGGLRALHHAVRRDNDAEIIALLMDYGADPTLLARGVSAIALAARRGRGDLLELFEQRGFPIALNGVDQLIAACARHDTAGVRALVSQHPILVQDLRAEAGTTLVEFAMTGNQAGIALLLECGVQLTDLHRAGDGYWDLAPDSSALHAAAWRGWHSTVRFLVERGAPVNARDGNGRTPLSLAVKATVDSYWMERRSPASVQALLAAGAVLEGTRYPSGYHEVDALLAAHGARLA